MLKFFIGVAIVAFASGCGYVLSGKYRKRKAFFSQFHTFNERFLNEISYYRRPVEAFAAAYVYQSEFETLLQAFFSGLKEASANERKVLDLSDWSFLTAEEKQMTENYFQMLGKGDVASQKGYFSSVQSTLKGLAEETEKAAKRYEDLYIKLGFLCGLLALILIV